MKTQTGKSNDGENSANGSITTATSERRGADRTRDDADWESKVLGRLSGRLHDLPAADKSEEPTLGWESSVLDVLRRRIERGPT